MFLFPFGVSNGDLSKVSSLRVLFGVFVGVFPLNLLLPGVAGLLPNINSNSVCLAFCECYSIRKQQK